MGLNKREVLMLSAQMMLLIVTVLAVGWMAMEYEKRTWQPSFPELASEVRMQFVSGTEYVPGQEGQVIVEARLMNGTSAAVPPCNITVWYPDKTVFVNSTSSVSGSNGNEYTNFTVPDIEGVYEYQAVCELLNGKTNVASKSFHVSREGIRAVMGK